MQGDISDLSSLSKPIDASAILRTTLDRPVGAASSGSLPDAAFKDTSDSESDFSSATVDLLDPNQSSLATLREELHASQLREEKS